ncbi:22100_t:CDS:2, partial [Gigaspora margarita]
KYNFGILKMDNNASNNSSNNNLLPNNIVCSHEPSHNTYESNSDSSIRTTQEIFIRMSSKRGRTQSKQAAQPLSSYNESRTCYASCSIERHNESRNKSRTHYTSRSIEHNRSFLSERRRSRSPSCGQQSSNQNQPCESYASDIKWNYAGNKQTSDNSNKEKTKAQTDINNHLEKTDPQPNNSTPQNDKSPAEKFLQAIDQIKNAGPEPQK